MIPVLTAAVGEGGVKGMESVKAVTDFMWTEVGTVVTTIVSTPLLLIPVGLFVAGGAIGLAKRFIGR